MPWSLVSEVVTKPGQAMIGLDSDTNNPQNSHSAAWCLNLPFAPFLRLYSSRSQGACCLIDQSVGLLWRSEKMHCAPHSSPLQILRLSPRNLSRTILRILVWDVMYHKIFRYLFQEYLVCDGSKNISISFSRIFGMWWIKRQFPVWVYAGWLSRSLIGWRSPVSNRPPCWWHSKSGSIDAKYIFCRAKCTKVMICVPVLLILQIFVHEQDFFTQATFHFMAAKIEEDWKDISTRNCNQMSFLVSWVHFSYVACGEV